MEHKHLTPVAVLTIQAVTSLLYFFNDPCKPIEIYVYAREEHSFTSYPAAKHSKFAITDRRQNQQSFYCMTRASTSATALILLTLVPVPKFQFL